MKNKSILVVLGIVFLIVIGGSVVNKNNRNNSNLTPTLNPTIEPISTSDINLDQPPTELPQEDKLCGWVNESDIIIKLNFADGVIKDTSYETGFMLNSTTRTARLARSGCDYRTGFNFEEMINKGVVQVAVWGYTDSNRRQLANEPINITFDENGRPNVEGIIEVTVLD